MEDRKNERGVAAASDWWLEIADEQVERYGVDRGRMFNSEGVKLPGGFYAFAGGPDSLMVKLPELRVRELIEQGRVEPVDMGGRVMREWAIVRDEPGGLDEWRQLTEEAREFVASLPPKPSKRGTKR